VHCKGIYRNGELGETKKLIAQYDEARGLYNQVLKNVKNVKKYKEDMLKHNEQLGKKAETGTAVVCADEEAAGKVILQVEEQMYKAFPVNRSGNDIINLSRESTLRKYFMEAEEELGIKPSKEVMRMRSRSRKGDYQDHLVE
jgi:seryl-tRNA synthetase